jgi:thiol-disulfide isomerase/thioredoxin
MSSEEFAMKSEAGLGRLLAGLALGVALVLGGCAARDEQAQGKKGAEPKKPDAKADADKAAPMEGDKSAEKKTDPANAEKPAATPSETKPGEDRPGEEKKPAEEKPKVDPPADNAAEKPADGAAKPNGDAPGTNPPSGDGSETPAMPPADAPPAETPPAETKPAEPVKINVEQHMQLILEMVYRPRAVRKTPDFIAQFVSLADEVIASPDASPGYKSTALNAKFKVLHEASIDGNAEAQTALVKLADAERENKGKRTAEYVRFVDAEKKLLDAKTADAASLPKLLEETKAYLSNEEELSNRHLRLADLSVQAVERLPEGERDAWYKSLGELFAKSVDLDLAYVGQRFGKPAIPPSALLGKPFELSGKLTNNQDLKWENYRDKIVLVDFWATWCTFCSDQEPRLKDVHAKYSARGLEMVGVSIDANKEDLTRYLREHEIPWITLYGKEPQEVAAKYGVRGVPTLFLIDAEGKILMRSNSIAELEPHIKTHVEALEKKLAEKRK